MFPQQEKKEILAAKRQGFYGPTWGYNPATGVWTNNPTVANGGLGAEKVTNGGFDPDSGWTKGTGWTIGTGVASQNGTVSQLLQQNISAAANIWYRISYDITARNANNPYLSSAGFGGVSIDMGGAVGSYVKTLRSANTNNLVITSASPAFNGSLDNISVRQINTASLFSSRNFGYSTNVTAKVGITNATAPTYPAGIAICLNSITAPASWYEAWFNPVDTKVYAFKVIAGTPTAIITAGTVTYTQNKKVSIVKDATTVKIYYDTGNLSAQVGSTYTILEGDPGGTIHGAFSTAASVLLGMPSISGS